MGKLVCGSTRIFRPLAHWSLRHCSLSRYSRDANSWPFAVDTCGCVRRYLSSNAVSHLANRDSMLQSQKVLTLTCCDERPSASVVRLNAPLNRFSGVSLSSLKIQCLGVAQPLVLRHACTSHAVVERDCPRAWVCKIQPLDASSILDYNLSHDKLSGLLLISNSLSPAIHLSQTNTHPAYHH